MIKVELKYNKGSNLWDIIGRPRAHNSAFCGVGLRSWWNVGFRDGKLATMELRRRPAEGTRPAYLHGDYARIGSKGSPIETEVYLFSALVEELQRRGAVEGQVYHVRFMI